MTSDKKRPGKRRLVHILTCLLGGAFMALAFPPYDLGNLVWVGLIPLLCVLWLGRPGFWRGFGYAWFYGMGWYCVSFWWIHNVGLVFRIPLPVFLGIAFLPLMTVYSCLVGLWGGLANTLLRPTMAAIPETEGLPLQRKEQAWNQWATADMVNTLRCAAGCGAAWVCVEWLRANGTLGFSWNSMGMALYNGLSLVQWAEFIGTAALSFFPTAATVILWCASRRAWLQYRATGRGCRPWDFYAMLVILFGMFAGGLALSKMYSPLVMMKRDDVLQLPVMGVQLNLDQVERIEDGPMQPRLYGEFLRTTRQAFTEIQRATMQKAQENPDLAITQQLPVWVVWPESAMGCPIHLDVAQNKLIADPNTTRLFFGNTGLPMVRRQVREMGGQDFVLFTGVDQYRWEAEGSTLTPRGMYNSMAIIPGGFESITTASKQHLMPFGEYLPLAQELEWLGKLYSEMTGTQVGDGIHPGSGDDPIPVTIPGTDETVGVIPAICYEDTVGRLLTKYARKGPQVIVNISNDGWFRDSCCGEQQARNAAFRCIELRRPMVRAANMGYTCAIAPNGAMLDLLQKADGSPHLAGHSYAVLPVDKNAGITLYALLGDWAVVLCALVVLVTSIPAFFRKKQA
ncbi:MAG: apolipoprotein N-acyltransferase [Akkermansia sp.]|nr:apolipoprotein N-acyltransferase [Akkermansia sp.]MBR2314290.1 apolipoprotein N-acyltransferase [Akkermansia sp.]